MEQILEDEDGNTGDKAREGGPGQDAEHAEHLTPAEVDEQWKELIGMLTKDEQVTRYCALCVH